MTIAHSNNFSTIHQPFFDKRTGSIALVGVITLHCMVGVGLAAMPMADIKSPKVKPPLEINFIAPPPVEVKPEEIKIEPEPKPIQPTVKPTVPPKSEPNVEPKIKKTIEPKVEPKPIQQPSKPIEKPIEKKIEKPVVAPKKEPIKPPAEIPEILEKAVVKKTQPDQSIIKAQQIAEANERAEQERQQALAKEQDLAKQKMLEKQQAIERQQALDKRLAEQQAEAKANAERKQADEDAKRKAKEESDAKAKKDAEDKAKAKQAQSNSPVTFSEGQASWRKKPNFGCKKEDIKGDALNATFRYTVDKQGNTTSVTLSKSTGNAKVDRQLTIQAKSGKFNPFTKDGVPVVGSLTIPVRCQ